MMTYFRLYRTPHLEPNFAGTSPSCRWSLSSQGVWFDGSNHPSFFPSQPLLHSFQLLRPVRRQSLGQEGVEQSVHRLDQVRIWPIRSSRRSRSSFSSMVGSLAPFTPNVSACSVSFVLLVVPHQDHARLTRQLPRLYRSSGFGQLGRGVTADRFVARNFSRTVENQAPGQHHRYVRVIAEPNRITGRLQDEP